MTDINKNVNKDISIENNFEVKLGILERKIKKLEQENKQLLEIALKKNDIQTVIYLKNFMKYN